MGVPQPTPLSTGQRTTTIGWILPMLHDPDGHEVRFYSTTSHRDPHPSSPLIVDDAVASAQAREAELLAAQSDRGTQ